MATLCRWFRVMYRYLYFTQVAGFKTAGVDFLTFQLVDTKRRIPVIRLLDDDIQSCPWPFLRRNTGQTNQY